MKKSLKDISNIITGHVFRSKIEYSPNGNIRLLNTDSISTTGTVNLTIEDVKKVNADDIKESEIVKSGDIIFKAKGLNNTAVLVKNIPNNTTVTASCHIIRITDKNILPEYICTWLNSQIAKKHFSMCAGQATGITIANVSLKTLESLPIAIPPLEQQKLIAGLDECTKMQRELQIKIADKSELLNRTIIEKELQKQEKIR